MEFFIENLVQRPERLMAPDDEGPAGRVVQPP